MASVTLRGLTKTFEGAARAAVRDLSLEVEAGELLVLLGPSGCGKTTLLRCIAGLERPTAGRIRLGGETVFDSERGVDIPAHRRDFGLVFQTHALWPHMNVQQNVEYPLRARGARAMNRRARVREVLSLVKCEEFQDRYPAELSGGQQQRIALARALAARPHPL